MYRELAEEVGLQPEQVEVIGETRGWLRYHLPRQYMRHSQPATVYRSEAGLVPAAHVV